MTDHLVADLEALLEHLSDHILAQRLILHVHHCIVKVGVKGGARRSLDHRDVQPLKAFGQLGHGHLHALFIFGIRRLRLDRTLEIVVSREQRGHRAADRVGIRLLALTLAALAEIVIFRCHAKIAVV